MKFLKDIKDWKECINEVVCGGCVEGVKLIPDNSIDAIVTDPPYELGFMGKEWDSTGIANSVEMWKECLRVLKPGGHLLSFSGSRTYHRMASAIEDAGFEVRDMIEWVTGSGFPKSLNLNKALQKKCTCGNMEVHDKQRTKQNTEHDLRPVPEANLSQEVNSPKKQGEVLQSGLSEQSVSLPGNSTANVWKGQSSLERGSDVEKNSRKLSGNDLCKMPEGISTNGEERRIHNATQVSDGSTPEQTTEENGSSASHRPQPEKQQDREPCAFCKQHGTQETRRLYEATYGLGSALKPAHEPICVARKPISEKTLIDNFIKWGTGGINIDESRVYTEYYLQGNDLSDIISICQLNHLQLSANNAELKKFQEDTTSVIKNLFSVAENVDMPILEKTLGKVQDDIIKKDTQCSEEMLMESINTNLNTFISGKNIMEKSQQDLKYITSMVLRMIIDWKIYNVSAYQLTEVLLTKAKNEVNTREKSGRFPANLLHDNSEEVRECFPETKSGAIKAGQSAGTDHSAGDLSHNRAGGRPVQPKDIPSDSGNASRFFKSIIYTAKASKADRNSNGAVKNTHPTCKPTELIKYLINMVSRDGQIILDPFMGSWTTARSCKALGRDFIGFELSESYCKIGEERLRQQNLF